MTLVTRDDIAPFPPMLHPNVVYVRHAEQLKPFILSKLINAEYAAYRCRTFSLLQERTRCSYLKILCENLTDKSYEALCDEQKRASHRRLSLISNSTKKRYFTNMRKIFARSYSTPDGPQPSARTDLINTSDKVECRRRRSKHHRCRPFQERRKNGKKAGRPGTSTSTNDDARSSITLSLPEYAEKLSLDSVAMLSRLI